MHFFKTTYSLALFAAAALGQSISINSPLPGSTVTAGSSITVQVGYPIYIQNVNRYSVVVGLQSCPDGTGCSTLGPNVGLGSVLGEAPYNPQYNSVGNAYQDFVVTIPASTPSGQANIGAVGFFVVGASYLPGLDYANATVYIA
ncbi:hypothetical protein HYDPIDRAFT_112187 [Hydnomerulius pinastri MD-312]|uniref:Uncharacterized protein n=1 Tax=Hydnomerulius pinastri MD-312 TaxID=994086 RepID=A0A0C9VFG2_9AGAM|nr:hypothetical protein HYDPIDRAFT_112187 [Hydnomerulius pinastri MD-312]